LFDATYAEANIGLLFGGMKSEGSDTTIDVSYLTLGLLGKYPFDLGSFTLFPMLGIQLDFGLSMKYEGNDVIADSSARADFMNRFWIKFGVGADFDFANFNLTDSSLMERLYLRPSFLYGINFGSKNDRDSDTSSFHHGLDIRVAVGYRF